MLGWIELSEGNKRLTVHSLHSFQKNVKNKQTLMTVNLIMIFDILFYNNIIMNTIFCVVLSKPKEILGL